MLLSLALALSLSAAPAQLTVDARPEGVEVKVDGKKVGTGGKAIVLPLKAGKHVVRLSFKGDSHEEEVALKAGEKKTYVWEFSQTPSGAAPTDEVTPSVE